MGETEPITKIDDDDLLNLHIQEYIALRSEQRTRLDSANKIIHYFALLIGVIIAGLLAVYKEMTATGNFTEVFRLVLLMLPLITIPFALTQQNEEILIRSIGSYFEILKRKISESADFWKWEEHHIPKIIEDEPQLITSLFRATLLIIFSILSLILYLKLHACLPFWSGCSAPFSYEYVLLAIDYFLIYLAVRINFGMFRARTKQVNKIKKLDFISNLEDLYSIAKRVLVWLFFLDTLQQAFQKNKIKETETGEDKSEES